MNNKKVNTGSELLIPKESWAKESEIQGCDLDVLRSSTMQRAFERVLKLHKPKHPIAVFGLCTSTRPYSKSRSWGQRIKLFGNNADLIITSNGGVIPIQFENCYPYLTYDAHGEKKYDGPYIEKLIERMELFLRTHRYRFVMFHYRHNLRNVKAARAVGRKLKAEGILEDYAILPNEDHYRLAQAQGFNKKGYSMYPELWPCMLNPVHSTVMQFVERAK